MLPEDAERIRELVEKIDITRPNSADGSLVDLICIREARELAKLLGKVWLEMCDE